MNAILENWKTTLFGLITGGSISLDAIVTQGLNQGWKQALLGAAVIVITALCKDATPSSSTPTADGKIVTNTPKTGISTPVINTTAPNKPIV